MNWDDIIHLGFLAYLVALFVWVQNAMVEIRRLRKEVTVMADATLTLANATKALSGATRELTRRGA